MLLLKKFNLKKKKNYAVENICIYLYSIMLFYIINRPGTYKSNICILNL